MASLTLLTIIILPLAYLVSLVIYRIYFTRISHIPGPKLASVTYLYHAWYDLWPHQGRFTFHLEELHKRYGPIIRIGPDEVHIKDVNYVNEIYPSDHRRKRNKSALFFWMVGTDEFGDHSAGATLDHETHRAKRNSMAPYFSARMVRDLEPRILGKVTLLRDKFLAFSNSNQLVELRNAMSGLTLDVISEYSFGSSFGALNSNDFGRPLNNMLLQGVKVHPFARIFRPLAIFIFRLPRWLMPASEILDNSIKYDTLISSMTQSAFTDAMASCENEKASEAAHRTIVHSMLAAESLGPEDKTFARLKADAMVLIGAGTETTARTLATALYHILATPRVYDKVLAEVRTIMPSADSPIPPVTKICQLKYLTAVLEESLRIAHGVAGRLSRIAPDEDLFYDGLKLPKGVTFSQSMYYIHSDPSVYPFPDEFHPERFLEGEEAVSKKWDVALAKEHLQPFGKGTRNCLGINLAWSELYLTVGALIGSVKMELVDTGKEDVMIVKEYFVGYLPEASKGIRVKVLGKS
ncbi:cytochrome P450-like protein [Podospora australis]|uniref:Cytochrome P450-like protein n=1 Tax=Podospora australis TaxID=1536484 RepID=A0AAN6WNF0_9PEZI|nr:cytochrome P450-like protein [Podospora australis]